jgi:histone acetyltransferase
MDAPGVSVSVGDTSTLDHCEIVSRDSLVRREEEQGEVKFHIIINDGDPIKLRILLELKNIFRKQLPQMPKEYIVRLVFDRNHKSVAAIKQGRVIGGITYRPFKEQKFGEIAFCAVSTTEQVRGCGTRARSSSSRLWRPPPRDKCAGMARGS